MEVVVFTNGCFDLLHPGHIALLKQARALGTKLIVGVNSDASVARIKGAARPFVGENDRAEILKNLRFVDDVRIFDEPTPERLIEDIKPDILVKGGDWAKSEIIGADFVEKNGGKVFSIPLEGGYSSSAIVDKIRKSETANAEKNIEPNGAPDIITDSLKAHIKVFEKLLSAKEIIENCAGTIIETLKTGNKILICGNGGSAADAQHIAAEFVGRYETERRAFPAIALTTDTSALTALANDYGFERVFSRQVEAHGKPGDLLIAVSTSGDSANVNAAVMTARRIGCKTIGLTGAAGKKLASLCDACILIPEKRTARIQEAHIAIAHLWCELVDARFVD